MDTDNSKILLNELKEVFNIILDNVEKEFGGNVITLDHDYYRQISLEEKYNVSDSPPEELLGQLYDDVEFIKKILDSPDSGVPLMLEHLSSILTYISYKSIAR